MTDDPTTQLTDTGKATGAAKAAASQRERLRRIIFEADTPAGKAFDVALLVAIGISVLLVSLESVRWIREAYGGWLRAGEWFFTLLFTVEYLLRLSCVQRPVRYATSFFGMVDLLAILPTYASAFVPGTHSFSVIRALRLMRVFRVLKLAQFVTEAQQLRQALSTSRRKITVFLGTVLNLVLILGALMYWVEGEAGGFTSIPQSIYWAIVTLTTVGYGDIAPVTPLGKFCAAAVMILGYSILAVPTGIVTAQMTAVENPHLTSRTCPDCLRHGHDRIAAYCKHCGAALTSAK